MNLATWNIQGLNTKYNEVLIEVIQKDLDVIVLTETKRKGRGQEISGGYIHFWSGVEKSERAKGGVSIMIKKKWKSSIKQLEEVDERFIIKELMMYGKEIVLIGTYAPTDDSPQIIKEQYFEKFTELVESVSQKKELIIMGDLNSRVGKGTGDVVGPYGEDMENGNGQRLKEECKVNDLVIMNSMFKHRDIHKFTWEQRTKGFDRLLTM